MIVINFRDDLILSTADGGVADRRVQKSMSTKHYLGTALLLIEVCTAPSSRTQTPGREHYGYYYLGIRSCPPLQAAQFEHGQQR